VSELEGLRSRYWPVIAETLHIRPWELGELTVAEFRQAVAFIDELREARHG
jgi:hypothetical protein